MKTQTGELLARAGCRLIPGIVLAIGVLSGQRLALAADGGATGQVERDEATRLFLAGRYEEAARRLEELSRSHPEQPGPRRKLGLCYYYLRRPEPALTNLRAYLSFKKDISPEDREDVERWIRELEALRPQAPAANTRPAALPVAPAPTAGPAPDQAGRAPGGEPSSLRALRRGFLLLPTFGIEIPVHARSWFSPGFRFEILLGGHLSERYSLSGEAAVATWTFSSCGSSSLYCNDIHDAVQLDASAILLRHVGMSWGEVVFGPKLGWAFVLRNNPEERTYPYVDGLQVGAKVGLMLAIYRSIALGPIFDLTYIRGTLATTTNKCFSAADPPNCSDTGNTLVGFAGLGLIL